MTDPDNPDYVTVQHVPGTTRYVVRLMHWDARADSYQVESQGGPLWIVEARLVAASMAQGLGVEYRP